MAKIEYEDGFSAEVLAEMEVMAYGRSSAAAVEPAVLREMELIAGGLHAPVEPGDVIDPDPARDDDDPGFDFPNIGDATLAIYLPDERSHE